MRITSYGAARGVTGSKHLIEINGHRILLDCGMFQGKRKEAAAKNQQFPFNGENVDVVLLSHAHIDHSGILPVLARKGYEGKIFATPATRDLCSVMLLDSAHIQERDAKWLSKKNQTFVPALYTDIEVREIMRRFICVPYDIELEVVPGVRATFKDAGHVLGSAMILIEFEENGKRRRLVFSGDIGPQEHAYPKGSLGAGRRRCGDHGEHLRRPRSRSHRNIGRQARGRGQPHLRSGRQAHRADVCPGAGPGVRVCVEAARNGGSDPDAAGVRGQPAHGEHHRRFSDYTRTCSTTTCAWSWRIRGDPFELRHIEYIRNREASMRLNTMREPMIIISAAGMCEHGRILHHLRNNCSDDRNTILIIGFQAKNTLGRRIVERDREIKIFGVKHQLRAEVKTLNSLSAHAGRSDLIEFGGAV